jgi:5,10-methylenetetrahydrofolate reductase
LNYIRINDLHLKMMDLRSTLLDTSRFVFLYGTTPPRADATDEQVERAVSRLAERIGGLELDGLIVYDVQDESSRTQEPRPFPYLPTLDSRVYARRLEQITAKPAITYKCVAHSPEQEWEFWLDETAQEYGIRYLSLVGRASSRAGSRPPESSPTADTAGDTTVNGISLARAQEMVTTHPCQFTLGGVVIPERHTPERSESERMIRKAAAGCEFFTSQAVYDPAATIKLCQDYARDCGRLDISPKRIILTFTPCGRPETLRFIKWLGVAVPEEVEQSLLASSTPLDESMKVCIRSLRAVLESGVGQIVPLGINVESVSIRKEEIEGSVELCRKLYEIANQYG